MLGADARDGARAPPGQPGTQRWTGSWALVFFAHILSGNPDWQRWYHEGRTASHLGGLRLRADAPHGAPLLALLPSSRHPRYVAAFERAVNQLRPHCRPQRAARLRLRSHRRHARAFALAGWSTPARTPAYCASRTGTATRTVARASDEWSPTSAMALRGARARRPRRCRLMTSRRCRRRRARAAAPTPPGRAEQQGQQAHRRASPRIGLDDWRRSRYFTFGARRPRDTAAATSSRHPRVRRAGRGGKKKVWLGSYFLPAISDYFWAPFAPNFFEADIQEHLGWPGALSQAMPQPLNDDPDQPDPLPRPPSSPTARSPTSTFIAFNTNEGIASITPERRLPGGGDWPSIRDPDGLLRRARPRCRYCGGPAAARARPRRGSAHRPAPATPASLPLRASLDPKNAETRCRPSPVARAPRAAAHRAPRDTSSTTCSIPQPLRGRL